MRSALMDVDFTKSCSSSNSEDNNNPCFAAVARLDWVPVNTCVPSWLIGLVLASVVGSTVRRSSVLTIPSAEDSVAFDDVVAGRIGIACLIRVENLAHDGQADSDSTFRLVDNSCTFRLVDNSCIH